MEISCPMCCVNISRNDIKKLDNIEKFLKPTEEEHNFS